MFLRKLPSALQASTETSSTRFHMLLGVWFRFPDHQEVISVYTACSILGWSPFLSTVGVTRFHMLLGVWFRFSDHQEVISVYTACSILGWSPSLSTVGVTSFLRNIFHTLQEQLEGNLTPQQLRNNVLTKLLTRTSKAMWYTSFNLCSISVNIPWYTYCCSTGCNQLYTNKKKPPDDEQVFVRNM